ncbi:hypothetical protein J14TS2_51690 [Bacillus sp. J14TS2]|nr:hypothetical protein J14TS2_51690 [Bacillus sp. J14TS2]
MVLAVFLYTQYFFTFNNLRGTLQEGPINSPNGEYTANTYYRTYGGAAGGVNIWVQITNNTDHKTKVIYYSNANSHFSISWNGANTLAITNEDPNYPESDNSINLDVRNEIYDRYGLACQSLLMKNDYKRCFKK